MQHMRSMEEFPPSTENSVFSKCMHNGDILYMDIPFVEYWKRFGLVNRSLHNGQIGESKNLAVCIPAFRQKIAGYFSDTEHNIYRALWENNIEIHIIVDRRHGEKYCLNLTFIEVQDTDLSLEFYHQPFSPAKENDFNLVQNIYEKQLESCFPINRERLLEFGHIHSQRIKLPSKDYHGTRIFRQKIATTMAMKRKLIRARAQFGKSKSENLRQAFQGISLVEQM